MTLKLNRVRALVKIHVHAKFQRANCSGSRVIVRTDKNSDEKNTVHRYHADSNNATLYKQHTTQRSF